MDYAVDMQKRYEWTLKNGLRVVYNHYPQAAAFTVYTIGKAGSMYETTHPGIAHFLEHVVMDATEKYPDEESLNRVINDVGGATNGGTNRDYVSYYAVTLAKDTERAFDFVSQILIHPLIKKESVEKQMKIITEEIHMYEADPASFGYDKSVDLLYPNTNLGGLISGTVEDIKKIGVDDLKNFYSSLYRAPRFVLSVCGSLPPEKARGLSEKYFEDMTAGDTAEDVESAVKHEEFNVSVANWQDIAHAHLYMQYYAPEMENEQVYAWNMMTDIFGGHELSRLFVTIREKHGLSYHVSSHLNAAHKHGYFTVYAGISDENVDKFLSLYKMEVDRICTELVSEDEFERTRNRLLASFLFRSDQAKSTAYHYGYNKLFGPSSYTFEDIVEKYKAVTREDIQKAAQDALRKSPKISVVSKTLTEVPFKEAFGN